MELEGARQGPARSTCALHSDLSCWQEMLTRRKVPFCYHCARRWLSCGPTSAPDPLSTLREAPKPLWASGFSFGLYLLCFHKACELWGNSREPHNLRADGFFSKVELQFASDLTLGAGPCAGSPQNASACLFFLQDKLQRVGVLAQGEILPSPWSPPWAGRGLSLSFQGLSTSKRQAQLSTRLALSPLSAGELWERKCKPLVSRYQSPHTSSLW